MRDIFCSLYDDFSVKIIQPEIKKPLVLPLHDTKPPLPKKKKNWEDQYSW